MRRFISKMPRLHAVQFNSERFDSDPELQRFFRRKDDGTFAFDPIAMIHPSIEVKEDGWLVFYPAGSSVFYDDVYFRKTFMEVED